MKIQKICGAIGGEAFLVSGSNKTALYDTGYAFCGDKLVKELEEKLGDKNLDYIFLTHSHYDHVSGCGYILERWPKAQVVASEYAAEILKKPTAIKIIKEMNDNAAKLFGVTKYEDKLEKLRVDIIVKDGDEIILGEEKLVIWQTPGHTHCSISFFEPKEKLLLSSESQGIYGGEGVVTPCFLVSYKGSIKSIKRGIDNEVEKILIPHYKVIEGETCKEYFKIALNACEYTKDKILEWHENGLTKDEMLYEYRKLYYSDYVKEIQPLKAFDLNAGYTIDLIIRECK